MTKAEYEQVGTFFANRYPSLREGNLQKIGKSRNYVISIFKIDMLDIVVLVFSIFNFFLLKFICSEKAAKFGKISTVDLTGSTKCKSTVEFCKNLFGLLRIYEL